MSIEDLSIYTLSEIQELREKAIESFKIVQKSIAGVPQSEIPTKKQIELNNLSKSIKRYNEEIQIRKNESAPIIVKKKDNTGSDLKSTVGKYWVFKNYNGFILLLVLGLFLTGSLFLTKSTDEQNINGNNVDKSQKMQESPLMIKDVVSSDKDTCNMSVSGILKIQADWHREHLKNYKKALGKYQNSLKALKCFCQKKEAMYFYASKLIEFSNYYCKMTLFSEAEKIVQEAIFIMDKTVGKFSLESNLYQERLIEVRAKSKQFYKALDKKLYEFNLDSVDKDYKLPSNPFK